jgi:N-glycosylase/DNA lyase
MQKAVQYGSGVRLLNQDCYEALISFIISQNNNIPRIKGIIERMSERYGTRLGESYLFPNVEQIGFADIDELSELRVGFRAKYIRDALDKLQSGEINLSELNSLNTEEARNELLKIKGVGRKVADCVLLFSMGRREVFPTDVWVKRVMEQLYFGGEDTDIKTIHSYAEKKWGKYSGYAQQYLFYYARSIQLGK